MRIHFDTTELESLSTDLKASTGVVEAKTDAAVRKVGFMVEADAKTNAPVRTGTLRGSIATTTGHLEAEISATTDYADYVEYGTSRMRPQPYMGPALDKNAPVLEKAVGKIAEGIL